MTVSALCIFLTVTLVGLQCVIVAFTSHTFWLYDVAHMIVIPKQITDAYMIKIGLYN